MRTDLNGLRPAAVVLACLVLMAGCPEALKARAGDAASPRGQTGPGARSLRLETVRDSLEADMLAIISRAEQGRVSAIRGEYYVPDSLCANTSEIGPENRKKLQARLLSASFKLKLDEARTWRCVLESFGSEIGDYLATKKGYRVVADTSAAHNGDGRTVSACLRLADTVYVWTPGCNCPKPKSSALATCAVVLVARAVDGDKNPIWNGREIVSYVGLESSFEEAFATKRIRKCVREAFKSFR